MKVLGGEGANRLHRVLRSERGLTYGASADTEGTQAGRRLRRRDRHANGDDRRSAAPDARRVLEAAAQARLRARADRRAGLSRRQLPADDRDAERHRHAGHQQRVLRAAASKRSARSASACWRSRRTTSSGSRSEYIKPDRLSIVLVGQRQGVRAAAAAARVHRFRGDPDRAARSDVGDAAARAAPCRRRTRRGGGAIPRACRLRGPADQSARGRRTPNVRTPERSRAMDCCGASSRRAAGCRCSRASRRSSPKAITDVPDGAGDAAVARRGRIVVYPDKFRVDAEVERHPVRAGVQQRAARGCRVRPASHDAPPAMLADFAANVRRDIITLLVDCGRRPPDRALAAGSEDARRPRGAACWKSAGRSSTACGCSSISEMTDRRPGVFTRRPDRPADARRGSVLGLPRTSTASASRSRRSCCTTASR